jgi:hypothetical protein
MIESEGVYGRKKRAWPKKIDSGVVFVVAVCFFKFGDGAKQNKPRVSYTLRFGNAGDLIQDLIIIFLSIKKFPLLR